MGTPDDKLGLTAEEDNPGVTISQDSEQGELKEWLCITVNLRKQL